MFKILFIGTENTYRSKFAQLYFNAVAEEKGLKAMSFSAGFKFSKKNSTVHKDIVQYLKSEQIDFPESHSESQILNEYILENNDRRICLDMEEHLTYMRKQFPEYVRSTSYWHYPSTLKQENPKYMLKQIQNEIDHLVASLTLVGVATV